MLETDHLGCTVGRQRVLDDVTIAFASGTVSLVTGPNGAGKTTLLRCMAGLERHDAGRILRGGEEVDVASERWKASVALVPDDNALFDELTVQEHLELACILAGLSRGEAEARSAPLIELLALERHRHHRSGELSFGYRKRLALALSLANPAEVYLLDEPLVGLDAEALDLFLGLLRLLRARGRIVVVATHITAPLAAIADAVVAMRGGKAGAAEAEGPTLRSELGPADLPWLG